MKLRNRKLLFSKISRSSLSHIVDTRLWLSLQQRNVDNKPSVGYIVTQIWMIQATYTHPVRSLSSLRLVPQNYIFHYLTHKRRYLLAKKEFFSPELTAATAVAAAPFTRYNDSDIFLIFGLTRTHHNRISSISHPQY